MRHRLHVSLSPARILSIRLYNASYIAPAYCSVSTPKDTTSTTCQPWFVYSTAMLGAFATGLGASVLWVAQGAYVAECAIEENTESFQGLFWCVYMLQAIIGNTLAYVMLQWKEAYGLFFVVMTLISAGGLAVFACILYFPSHSPSPADAARRRRA